MERTWSTDCVPESERFPHWREIVSEAFVPVAIARRGDGHGDGDFRSRVSARAVGPLRVSRIESEPQSVARTASLLRRDAGDSYFLNLPLTAGTSASQHARTAHLCASDFTLVDSRAPFELSFPRRFAQVSVQIPHELLDAHRVQDAALAMRVDGQRGAGALASGALRACAADTSAIDRHSGRRIADQLCGLIALALTEPGPPPGPTPCTHEQLVREALAEIDAGLADPDLSPRLVAGRISVSPRYLHRLFSERGTSFGRCLLARRLERADERLRDPAQAQRPIGEIARDVGFSDPSYFARAFKARYGVTPRQARLDAR